MSIQINKRKIGKLSGEQLKEAYASQGILEQEEKDEAASHKKQRQLLRKQRAEATKTRARENTPSPRKTRANSSRTAKVKTVANPVAIATTINSDEPDPDYSEEESEAEIQEEEEEPASSTSIAPGSHGPLSAAPIPKREAPVRVQTTQEMPCTLEDKDLTVRALNEQKTKLQNIHNSMECEEFNRELFFSEAAQFKLTQILKSAAQYHNTLATDFPEGQPDDAWLKLPRKEFYRKAVEALRLMRPDTGNTLIGFARVENHVKEKAKWHQLSIIDNWDNLQVFSEMNTVMSNVYRKDNLRTDEGIEIAELRQIQQLLLDAISNEGWAQNKPRGKGPKLLGAEVVAEYKRSENALKERKWSEFETKIQALYTEKANNFQKMARFLTTVDWKQTKINEGKTAEKQQAKPSGATAKPADKSPNSSNGKHGHKKVQSTTPNASAGDTCNACGRPDDKGQNHNWESCKFRAHHPDHNPDKHIAWKDSDKGKAWNQRYKQFLPNALTLDKANPTGYKPVYKTRGECPLETLCMANNNGNNPACFNGHIINTHSNILYPVIILSDSGAIPSNYISHRLVNRLPPECFSKRETEHAQVQGGIADGHEAKCEEIIECMLCVHSNHNKKEIIFFQTHFRILEMNTYDVILGLEALTHSQNLQNTLAKSLKSVAHSIGSAPCTGGGGRSRFRLTEISEENFCKTHLPHAEKKEAHTISGGVSQFRQEVLMKLNDTNNHNNFEEDIGYYDNSTSSLDTIQDRVPSCIQGSPDFIAKQQTLCRRYITAFSRELNKEPAKIPPLEITVDEAKWNIAANRQPPRRQGMMRNREINAQVTKMLEAGVITPSRAPAYSQVLLVPKPDQKWRFCIDYRALNAVTQHLDRWPIPNIRQALDNLGTKKYSLFFKIDQTKGYYQAPMSANSKEATAFITPDGLFQWERVPMGPAGAASHFQRQMATKVLAGLIHITCESYLDDILGGGVDEEDYLNNLETILKRLNQFGITINPDKCQLGLSEIEYLGHTINREGTGFTPEKLRQVLDFPKPKTEGEVRSFLGLANFFREHVKNHSLLAKPLQDMITGGKLYKKSKQLNWAPETEAAFIALRTAVTNAPKLFFIAESDGQIVGEIHLYTDASDVGYGACLTQIINEKHVPIQFMSRTFTKEQKKWHAPEREAYGTVASVIAFTYLLRDIFFHLHTDHKNFIYLKEPKSDKVFRWKLKLQEFSFKIYHIEGTKNHVADYMSRNSHAPEDEYTSPTTAVNLFANLQELHLMSQEESDEQLMVRYEFESIPDDAYNQIERVHNEIAGHHGVQNTFNKLHEAGVSWKYMRQHIQRFIEECDTCQKMNTTVHPINTHPYTTGGNYPFETLAFDFIGPFTEDIHGNTHAGALIDTFSRFLNLIPTKSTSAEDGANVLLQHTALFGMPKFLQTDGGSEFANKIIAQFTKLVGAEHIQTLAYAHQEQGIVERSNKETQRWIRDLIYNRKQVKSTWSQMLPFATRIHNATVIKSIGYSPARIIYGDSINLNRNIFIPNKERQTENIVEYMSNKLATQDEAISLAAKLSKEHNIQHITENPVIQTEFTAGSYVLVAWPITRMNNQGRPSKFDTMFRGPYQVQSNKGRSYILKDLVLNKNTAPKDIHQLRPFHFDPRRTNPLQVALKDYKDLWVVERIQNHKGSWKTKSHMTFLVKWVGWETPTWQPWKDVRDCKEFHDYLEAKGKSDLRPKRFTVTEPQPDNELINRIQEITNDPWLNQILTK